MNCFIIKQIIVLFYVLLESKLISHSLCIKNMHNYPVKKITPQQAQQILEEGKLDVTIKEAELILDFLYNLADIVLSMYVFPNEKSDLSPSEFNGDDWQ